MNCNEVQQLFGIYWDLPEEDERKRIVDRHVGSCSLCGEEFRIWKESTELIRTDSGGAAEVRDSSVSSRVMGRIYAEEAWRLPVPDRIYTISPKLRRNVLTAFICCLALFGTAFVWSFFSSGNEDAIPISQDTSSFGLHPVAAVQGSDPMNAGNMEKAVASLSDPFMLKTGPIHTWPDYFLALSIVGTISVLLIMNWLSRTDA
jgi:hypothetical protein